MEQPATLRTNAATDPPDDRAIEPAGGEPASPSGHTAVPSGHTAIPSGHTAIPSGNTAIPSRNTAPPPGSTAIPTPTPAHPLGDTAIPNPTTAHPPGDTAIPSGDTAVPSGDSAAAAGGTDAPVATPTEPAGGDVTVGQPERLGEYLVRRLLGEGGMGKVYEAEERLSKRKVALKVLRPELSRSEHGRRLFLNEMTILAHLDHPNVVRCLACQEIDGELVMALELLEGPTLRALLAERGRIPWAEAVAITSQMAAGLSAAHQQQPPIVHRDLKPDNVALVPAGAVMQVKVMDFGIAKVLEALSSTTTHSVGTLQYMSPEQIDAGEIGPRADLYALGLVLYEMLAGQAPFESASPRELLNKQCTEAPPPLPEDVRAGLPKGVERVMIELLQKRPEDRPATAQAVLEALEPFATAGVPLSTASTKAATVPPVGIAAAHDAVAGVAAPPAAASAVAAKAKAPAADTIGIVDRASAPRQVPAPLAFAIIMVLSLIAGVITYVVRTGEANGAVPAAARSAAGPSATPADKAVAATTPRP